MHDGTASWRFIKLTGFAIFTCTTTGFGRCCGSWTIRNESYKNDQSHTFFAEIVEYVYILKTFCVHPDNLPGAFIHILVSWAIYFNISGQSKSLDPRSYRDGVPRAALETVSARYLVFVWTLSYFVHTRSSIILLFVSIDSINTSQI